MLSHGKYNKTEQLEQQSIVYASDQWIKYIFLPVRLKSKGFAIKVR